ncbi:MAG: hypothetical protein ACRDJO_02265 [Actinomycetota bacterium]
MTWADVPLWVSIVVMTSGVAAVVGVGALLLHAAARDPGSGASARDALTVAAALGAWLAVAVALAGAGVFRARETTALPMAVGVGLPLVAGVSFVLLAPAGRRLARALHPAWAIALQTPRVLGFVFLALMAQDRLPAVFALRAGWGDVAVGAAAPLVALAYLSGRSWAPWLGIGFNVAGLADLAVAVGTGIMAAPGPLRQLLTTPSTEIMTLLPMIVIPIFLVPLLASVHVFSIRQLLEEARRPQAVGARPGHPRSSRPASAA